MSRNITEALGSSCRMISANNCNDCEFLKYRKPGTDCQAMCIAEELYNAGYQKVPENAVVLTKEEYERLKSDRKIRVVTKHEEDDYEICIPANEYDEMFEQARKETAKEILKILYDHGIDKEIMELCSNYDVNGIALAEEICKKYSVEVEE